jgi:hypothetical protein
MAFFSNGLKLKIRISAVHRVSNVAKPFYNRANVLLNKVGHHQSTEFHVVIPKNIDMNPEMVSPDYTDETENPKLLEPSNGDTKLLLPQKLSTDSSNAQWQQYGERIASFLRDLPSYVTGFFEENKGPLGGIGLIVLALVTVKVTLALVDAIDDIPLVAPTLELIGLGYAIWFVYRYLLQASSRQELSEEIKTIKERVLGSKT